MSDALDERALVAEGMAVARAHRAQLGAINAEAYWEGALEAALREVARLRAILAQLPRDP